MSEMEYTVGKAINLTKETREKYDIISFPALLHLAGSYVDFEYTSAEPDYIEWTSKDKMKEIVFVNGDFWLILHEPRDEYINHATKNPDGTIDFAFAYYNGGTYFENEFETALTNLEIALDS